MLADGGYVAPVGSWTTTRPRTYRAGRPLATRGCAASTTSAGESNCRRARGRPPGEAARRCTACCTGWATVTRTPLGLLSLSLGCNCWNLQTGKIPTGLRAGHGELVDFLEICDEVGEPRRNRTYNLQIKRDRRENSQIAADLGKSGSAVLSSAPFRAVRGAVFRLPFHGATNCERPIDAVRDAVFRPRRAET